MQIIRSAVICIVGSVACTVIIWLVSGFEPLEWIGFVAYPGVVLGHKISGPGHGIAQVFGAFLGAFLWFAGLILIAMVIRSRYLSGRGEGREDKQ